MVLTAGATYKLLFIKHLTEIRVVVFATLKIPNTLMHNQLRGAQRKKIPAGVKPVGIRY